MIRRAVVPSGLARPVFVNVQETPSFPKHQILDPVCLQ